MGGGEFDAFLGDWVFFWGVVDLGFGGGGKSPKR